MRNMTSKERVWAAIRREEPDRVPLFPLYHYATTRLVGMRISQFATGGEHMAQALMAAQRRFGLDGVDCGCDVCFEGEALGSRIEQPDDAPAFVTEPVLKNPADLDKLKVPDPHVAGRMPVVLKATETCVREIGDHVFVTGWTMGPMNAASQVRGVENLMFDLVDRPRFVEELLEFCGQVCLEYARPMIDNGVDMIGLGEALCSPAFISPKTYAKVVVPHQQKLIAGLKAYGAKAVLLHICGRVEAILPSIATTGADVFDVDWSTDIARAKEYIVVRGNLDPARVLLQGSREEVRAMARDVLQRAGPGGGLILGSGCDVSPATPLENIEAMAAAIEEFGAYPIGFPETDHARPS